MLVNDIEDVEDTQMLLYCHRRSNIFKSFSPLQIPRYSTDFTKIDYEPKIML